MQEGEIDMEKEMEKGSLILFRVIPQPNKDF